MFFTYPMESFVARHVLVMVRRCPRPTWTVELANDSLNNSKIVLKPFLDPGFFLDQLVHNGDMDARGGFTLENESRVEEEELGEQRDDDATVQTTASIIEGGGMLCMNRRQTWTVLVYLVRHPLNFYSGQKLCCCLGFASLTNPCRNQKDDAAAGARLLGHRTGTVLDRRDRWLVH